LSLTKKEVVVVKLDLELIAMDANPYKLGGINLPIEEVLAVYRFDKALLDFAVENKYLPTEAKLTDLTAVIRENIKDDYVQLGGTMNGLYPSAYQLKKRKNLN
jgi:hypothetical protein